MNIPWEPISISSLCEELRGFPDWVICGGHSIALFTGADSRAHGDIDVGVFRSQAEECLRSLDRSRIYLCRGKLDVWDGGPIPPEVHDIWVAHPDLHAWAFQIMIYDDEGGRVIYRRDRRLSWDKSHHAVQVGNIRILNPMISFLFKSNRATMEPKEVHDLAKLIASVPPVHKPLSAAGELVIRIYQHGDHARIAEIFTRAIHEIACDYYSPEQCCAWSDPVPNPAHWRKRCELMRPFVAVLNGEIAGFLELDPNGHIDCAYIHPDYKRRGIITQLVRHAVQTCFAMGRTRVWVEASLCARPMFEKAGFTVENENLAKIRGAELQNYRMQILRDAGPGHA